MLKIQETLAAAGTLSEVYPLLQKAEPHLSFWGFRYITVQGYTGTLSLDAFTKRVVEIVVQIPEPPRYPHRGWAAPFIVKNHITRIYAQSDAQIKAAHCFTRLLTNIRYFRLHISDVTPLRSVWEYNKAWPSLEELMAYHTIRPEDVARLKGYLTLPAAHSFFYQLKEDILWNLSFMF